MILGWRAEILGSKENWHAIHHCSLADYVLVGLSTKLITYIDT